MINICSRLSIILFFCFSFFIFTSCKDNSDVNKENSYFSNDNIKCWVYDNYIYPVGGTPALISGLDTISKLKDTFIIGKNAKWMRHHFVNVLFDMQSNYNYAMYEKDNVTWISSDFLLLFLPDWISLYLPFSLFNEMSWIKLIDGNAEKNKPWFVDSAKISNFNVGDVLQLPYDFILNGYNKISVERSNDTNFYNVDVHQYSINFYYEGGATTDNQMINFFLTSAGTIRINFLKIDIMMLHNMGIQGILCKPSSIAIQSVQNPKLSIPIPDSEMTGFVKNLNSIIAK